MVVGQVAIAQRFGRFEVDYGMVFAASVILGLIPGCCSSSPQRNLDRSVASIGLKE